MREALNRSIPELATSLGLSEEEVREQMVVHLKHFGKQYYSGHKPDNPYSDAICRLAYMYCYVPANANLFEIAIKRTPDLEEFIEARLEENDEITVCAFGGGPGTELLGLAKYLIAKRKKGPPVSVSFTLLDRVEEWAESWTILEEELKRFLRDKFGKVASRPFVVNRSFIPFDVTDLAM